MKSKRAAYSARMAGVASREPSSTITHKAGRTLCAMTESSVRRANSASSRQGVIRT